MSTNPDIKQHIMSSTVSTDCEVSADIPEHCMFDYNILHSLKCEHERPEDMRTNNSYGRQEDDIQGHVVQCLPSVKSEETRQELSEQRHGLPFNSTDRESNLVSDANATIQLKPEKKEDPDGCDTNNEATRHWVVCPDGVLKQVKAEHTSDVSDILSVGDCSKKAGHKQCTQTVSYHNNVQTNVKVSTHSTCGVSSKQFRGRGNDPKAHRSPCKIVKHFNCDTCGKQFVHLCRLKMQERTHTGVKPLACDTCGKSFTLSGTLKRHETTHTRIKPFVCDTRGTSFARPGDVNNHETTHACVKPFACDICGESFAQQGSLKSHEITHTGVKPFVCDTCGKSFTRSGNVKQHERTHTSVKPFACDTCGKSFARPEYVKRHERTHTGVIPVKPFACDACEKLFAHSGALKMHERTHTGVKPFVCETCGK